MQKEKGGMLLARIKHSVGAPTNKPDVNMLVSLAGQRPRLAT